ncbi:saccharopine dehydrogenase NADP-binding domain-containing protein [Haliea sp. E1-2-M8]|uniref:saccharopine dehydrogenase family protein n=1 Tax=Haliea sp. E1-2-M8 TaxID=3064706 RepID=UPI0027251BB5|nr:saccharopine dehydrogenase NADP-binding domain-containing protein [Haliea sp. E1-2-M8]MDO8863831.1 saccharopine dehydrogenase NADP-binding domain-containing protein [Haliea sp. E1-2-M8]
MRVVILGGAGLMGKGIALDLLSEQSEDVTAVVVADSNKKALSGLNEAIQDKRFSVFHIDVREADAVRDILSEAQVCINAVPTFAGLQMDIFKASLDAGCPYIDLGGMGIYTQKQKDLHPLWQDAGLSAVLGCGADPGMSNVLCKAVAEKLDSIENINLFWAGKIVGPDSPVLIPLYNIYTLLAEYHNSSWQFLDGKLREQPAQSGHETIILPEPFGETEFMFSQHSEPLTVPFAKGIAEKGINEMTWKLHLPEQDDRIWKSLVKAGFGSFDEPVDLNGMKVSPGELLSAVISRNIERNHERLPEQEDYQIHFAVGHGECGGLPTTVRATVTSVPDEFFSEYHDAGTSMNASIAAQLLVRQEGQAGVFSPEEFFDVSRYFAELKKRRFKITLDVCTDVPV